eukprot:390127-Prymnesium_polylepis.4
MPAPGEMVTRSPVSSVQSSPSFEDFHTAVPYSSRPMALRSTPLRTSVLPDHERLPSIVAPYLNSGAAALSSVHERPPSMVRSGTAPLRSMNMVLESLTRSLANWPVSPVAVLQFDQLAPWSVLWVRQPAVTRNRLLALVGSTAIPPAWRLAGRGLQLQFCPKSLLTMRYLTVPCSPTWRPGV